MLSVVFWSAPFCQRKITQARLNDAQCLRKMKTYTVCKNKRLRRLTAMEEQAKKCNMCSDH